jgi:hypothetical protein
MKDRSAFQVRFPPELNAVIKKAAATSQRSKNAEIVWRITKTFDESWHAFVAEIERKEIIAKYNALKMKKET